MPAMKWQRCTSHRPKRFKASLNNCPADPRVSSMGGAQSVLHSEATVVVYLIVEPDGYTFAFAFLLITRASLSTRPLCSRHELEKATVGEGSGMCN
eukprot:5965423-Pyramimonas_sp.AAC.2